MNCNIVRPKIIAVDFDGTIVQHRFPEIGTVLPGAIPTLKALKKAGHKLFLWTMRGHPTSSQDRDVLQEALDFCKDQGVEFDCINESPTQFSSSRKQYAHLYIDDAAACSPTRFGELDWTQILLNTLSRGILTVDQVQEVLDSPEWKQDMKRTLN